MPALTETVREIAVRQPSAIRVFEQFGIDYCCGGRQPLAMACNSRNVEIDRVLEALAAAATETPTANENCETASLSALCEHIVNTHHVYVKTELPRLDQLACKTVARHGTEHAELGAIQEALEGLSAELTQHLAKEEMILFPYIVQMENARVHGGEAPHGCFGSVASPIAMMTQEHDAAGEVLREMRRLSGDFKAPEDACPTWLGFYRGLVEFEQDLHRHIHLENNILFPKAVEMEAAGTTS